MKHLPSTKYLKSTLILFTSTAALLLTSCMPSESEITPYTTKTSPEKAPSPPAPSPPKITADVNIDEESDGKTITLAVGQKMHINLRDNPSTGYHWKETNDSDSGVLASLGPQSYKSDPAPAGMVGVPGTSISSYQAKKTGTQTLRWAHMPPGAGQPPAEILTFRIMVR
jgi:predicted secreted protein